MKDPIMIPVDRDPSEFIIITFIPQNLNFICIIKVCTMYLFVISGFRRDADEICALLGYNASSSGNLLPTFRDNVSVPSQRSRSPRRVSTFL
jgi:hypothetical protein